MKFADPYALRIKTPRDTLVFAACQRNGIQQPQEDYFLNFNDECFVLADGVGAKPNGETAAKLASETAIWAYKHIRQHPYYWKDKKLFQKRIFRSTNLTIWQKQRETGFEGIATTLLVVMVGQQNYWLGRVGDSSAWICHDGVIKKLTKENDTRTLGERRLGLTPDYTSGSLRVNETLVLATDGCADYLLPSDISDAITRIGVSTEQASQAVAHLIDCAETNGSTANMTAVVIKRVPTKL